MDFIIYIIALAVFAFGGYIESRNQLHMAQLEGYKPRQYWWWIKHNLAQLFLRDFIVFLTAIIALVVTRLVGYADMMEYITIIIWTSISGYVIIYPALTTKKEAKKPLVFTHRAIRLFTANILLLALWAVLGFIYSTNTVDFIVYLSALKLVIPFNMLLAAVIMYPVEMAIQYRYYKAAQTKIRGMKNLKVIGITGSYGKTSTKYFLKTILSERYNTLMTPESYNTPMGITRVIREQLNTEHEVFVCEMGARNVGDISTLCKLVGPSIGILTSVGPQHLETFRSIGNVAKTKYELIESLPYDGTAIFNGDNGICLELARKTGIETLIYGVNNRDSDMYVYADDIKISKQGLKFSIKGQNIDIECQTKLLGKHNVSNMLAAVCAALKLGLTPEEVKRGILKIEPVPHRLQILPTDNGVTVIDDAFNSNPVGAREALETIRQLEGGDKIVITPGMVELGSVEYEENKKFGSTMAACADYAILVGVKRSRPIVEGLRSQNFPEDRIIVVRNLAEATARFGQIVKPDDVVLFENDLPDNYNEE